MCGRKAYDTKICRWNVGRSYTRIIHAGKSDVDCVTPHRRLSTRQAAQVTIAKAHLAKTCQHGKMLRDQIPDDNGPPLSTTLLDSCNARCNPGMLPLRNIGRARKVVIIACGKVAVANVVLAEHNDRHDNEPLCRVHSDDYQKN